MTDNQRDLIATAWRSPEYARAFEALCAKERDAIINELRAAVAEGNAVRAAIAEGRMRVLDELPTIIRRYAEAKPRAVTAA